MAGHVFTLTTDDAHQANVLLAYLSRRGMRQHVQSHVKKDYGGHYIVVKFTGPEKTWDTALARVGMRREP